MGKKDKPQVINNIQELNLEVDCDKLAEAIVKAQENANEYPNEKMTIGFFAIISNLFFNIAGWIIAVLSVVLCISAWVVGINSLSWNRIPDFALSGFILIITTLILVVIFLISIMMIGTAKEIKKSRDKNFIISVFSALTGLVALIIALIALFKGV